jgi:hypothetical protein
MRYGVERQSFFFRRKEDAQLRVFNDTPGGVCLDEGGFRCSSRECKEAFPAAHFAHVVRAGLLEPLTDRLDFFTWSGVWGALPQFEDMFCEVEEIGLTDVAFSLDEFFFGDFGRVWYYDHKNSLRGTIAQNRYER